jgi:hypothetical protein
MEAAILIPFLAAAMYHLGARAKITEPLWSLWEGTAFDRFLACAACSGTWYGAGWALLGFNLGWSFLGAPMEIYTPIIVGLCTMITTPMLAYAQEYALAYLSYGEGEDTDEAA